MVKRSTRMKKKYTFWIELGELLVNKKTKLLVLTLSIYYAFNYYGPCVTFNVKENVRTVFDCEWCFKMNLKCIFEFFILFFSCYAIHTIKIIKKLYFIFSILMIFWKISPRTDHELKVLNLCESLSLMFSFLLIILQNQKDCSPIKLLSTDGIYKYHTLQTFNP